MFDFLGIVLLVAVLVFVAILLFDIAVICLALIWVGFKRFTKRFTKAPNKEWTAKDAEKNKAFIEAVERETATKRIRFDGSSDDFEADLHALMRGYRAWCKETNYTIHLDDGYVFVEDFGAVGDGVTDNTKALNAAQQHLSRNAKKRTEKE